MDNSQNFSHFPTSLEPGLPNSHKCRARQRGAIQGRFVVVVLAVAIAASLGFWLSRRQSGPLAASAITTVAPSHADPMPDAWNGVSIRPLPGQKDPAGGAVLEVLADYSSTDLEWPSFINFWTDLQTFPHAKRVEISFWVCGDAGSTIGVRVVSERHINVSPVEKIPMTGEWQRVEYFKEMRNPSGMRWAALPRIMFTEIRAGQKILLGPVKVELKD